MRKLICCAMTGVTVLVGGYRGLRYAEATRIASIGLPVVQNSCESAGQFSGAREESGSTACFDGCSARAHRNRHCGQAVDDQSENADAPVALKRTIDLPASSVDAPAVIYIPQSVEPPETLPDGDAKPSEEQRATVPARIMPNCDDEPETPTMPPVDADPWPAKPVEAVRPTGWFEESEPADAMPMPACREDDNLFRQYPGCPFPGDSAPTGKDQFKPGSPWRHEKQPILPAPTDVRVQPAQPGGVESEESRVPVSAPHNDNLQPQAPWNEAGLRRYTTFKYWLNQDTEKPVRQKVDTLELRPGDLRRDESWLDWF
jgi:hypothetical protein